MLTQTRPVTAEELAQMTSGEERTELVRGEVIRMSPASFTHGRIALKIGTYLNLFVMEHQLGEAYAAETGFILERTPDSVRAPDVAFVTAERLQQQRTEGFFEGAPDLAVEVISPSETAADIDAKVIDYLNAGTRFVWLVYPRTRTVTEYRSLAEGRIFTSSDTLSGGDLLPGFSLPVKAIFE